MFALEAVVHILRPPAHPPFPMPPFPLLAYMLIEVCCAIGDIAMARFWRLEIPLGRFAVRRGVVRGTRTFVKGPFLSSLSWGTSSSWGRGRDWLPNSPTGGIGGEKSGEGACTAHPENATDFLAPPWMERWLLCRCSSDWRLHFLSTECPPSPERTAPHAQGED